MPEDKLALGEAQQILFALELGKLIIKYMQHPTDDHEYDLGRFDALNDVVDIAAECFKKQE